MKNIFVCVIIALILSACSNGNHSAQLPYFDTVANGNKFRVETIKVDSGFGYDIFLNDKKVIHQNIIPAIQAVRQFKDPQDALNVGYLVITKMIESSDFPTVDRDELRQLKVID